MSSLYVRDTVTDFIVANTPEKVVDLSGRFEDMKDMIEEEGLTPETPWVGVEFTGNDEIPITIGTSPNIGTYRETGAIAIHIVGIAALSKARDVIVRADALRFKLRGNRIDRVIIQSVTPANTDSGSSINLTQGYFSASFLVEYECDSNF